MKETKKNSVEVTLQIISHENLIPTKKHFTKWVLASLPKESKKLEINIRVVDITESAALNFRYRNKNSPTNVLSFPCCLPSGIENSFLGDLVICAPIVKEEAEKENKPLQAHYAHMTIHGVLHLLGYDHQISKQAEIMEGLEAKILNNLGF